MEHIQATTPDFGNLFMKYVGDAISRAVEDGISRALEKFNPVRIQNEPASPKYYTRDEVRQMLHISFPTLHGLMKKDAIKFIKVGKKTLFPQAELDAMIASGELRKYRRTC
jgi:hypothetical protein